MILTAVMLFAVCLSNVAALIDPHRKSKRIASGEPVPSMDTYRTYYYVQLRRSWACVTDQTNHEDALTRCEEDYHKCGGTLIHPEFVLTAAHCLMYYEVVLRFKGEGEDDWIRTPEDFFRYDRIYKLERLKHFLTGLVIVPKPRHTVYSDWAMIAGSNDWFKMTQKRHVTKVFPHRKFPKDLESGYDRERFKATLNTFHDVSLLRACQPFKIKSGEVEIAPMLNSIEQLREQYDRIVQFGQICLYIGFGKQGYDECEASESGLPYHRENLLLHTWRSSKCSADCNYYQLAKDKDQHTCFLCSTHHGPNLGVPQPGDSGGPVTCGGKFVATMTKAFLSIQNNSTQTGSYPLHCIKHAINEDHLNYYKTVNNSNYHPLNGTRLRRLPLPPEWL